MNRFLFHLISAYRVLLAPLLGPCCRFAPSCSEYAREAIVKKGALRGIFAAALRLSKCHPFHGGGYDPVE